MPYDPEPEDNGEPKEWVTYSFKCLRGRDNDLIEVLDDPHRNRSNLIRRKLRAALRLPDPVEAETLTVDTLRAEIDRIIEVIQNTTFVEIPQESAPRRSDVSPNGARIPNF